MVDVSSCKDFADFLTQLMDVERLTRKDLEELLRVSKGMVSKYLNDGSSPDDAKLRMICDRYPSYDFKQLHDLANGIKRPEIEYTVRTEFGAKVGRIAEAIKDESVRFAILQLISSLERDTRKNTGTE
jgi:transcriptional regulator with XRE-family HTH domain